MKINLIGAFRYPCAIEKYYARAICDLGHTLTVTTPDKINDLARPDLTIVVKWCDKPDLLPSPKALIFTDLTTRFQGYYLFAQGFYDYVFLVHKEPWIDNKRVFYLPVAYDPHEHFYVENEKDIGCLFIGTMHPSREFMREIPIITRYGNEWGDTVDVYGDKYRELCSRSRIIINNHYPGDSTNMRDYEAPNFKAMILTDKTPFKPGEDAIIYENPKDLENKIHYYLDHENERKELADNAYATVTAGKYKYTDRIEELLSIVKNNINNINNVNKINNIA